MIPEDDLPLDKDRSRQSERLSFSVRAIGALTGGFSYRIVNRIYCRHLSGAAPKRRNIVLFERAAAEGAGYRPCCWLSSERAPGLARSDAASRLANAVIAG